MSSTAKGNNHKSNGQNHGSPIFKNQSVGYHDALGVRGLGTTGISIKHFTKSNQAIEGIVGLWPNAFSATVLLEYYVPAFGEPGLNWYYGAGAHIASESNLEYYDGLRGYRSDEGVSLGIDGIFGLEYKIQELPMAISLDMKPFFEMTTSGKAYLAADPGLTVKLTF